MRCRDGLRADVRALVGYVALTLIFYAPLLLGVRSFPAGDFTDHFLPFSLFQRSELLAGRLPVWNPYTFAGHPFLADVQAAVFYPLSNVLLLLTLPWAAPEARLYWLQAEAALHVALAGFFTYLLVRELTDHPWAAFVAGAAFAFSGYLTGYPPLQLAVLRTAIWLPLLLWLLWRAFVPPARWRWWVVAALVYVVAFLAGHPQTFFFLSNVVAAWIVLLFVSAWCRPAAKRLTPARSLPRIAAFFLLSLALSAAQLWPSLEFTRLSVRANVDYAFLSGGFPVQDSWQMLLPGVLTVYSPLYVSVAGLGLAVLALWRLATAGGQLVLPARSPGPANVTVMAFFAGVTLFFLLVSYGGNGFLYALLYRWSAPGWKLFRGQERAAYIVAFGLSVLAGYGAVLLGTLPIRLRRLGVSGFAGLVIAGTILFSLVWQGANHTAVSDETFLAIAGVTLLWSVLFVALLWRGRLDSPQMLLLVTLVVADLFRANLTIDLAEGGPASRVAVPPELLALESAMRDDGGIEGVRGRVYNEYRVYDDYGMQARVEDVWGSSPLHLARYAALFEEFPLDRMWRLTGVEHVLTWRRELFEPSVLLAEFPQAKDTTYLHHLAEPNPRAWVVNTVRLAEDAAAVGLLADHSFDLETTALLAPGEGAGVPGGEPPASVLAPVGQNHLEMRRSAPNRLLIDVQSEHGGLLVVSENWMPGWQAFERGPAGGRRAVPVLRADLSFLGLPVPAGTTTVELVYWPASVRDGLFISVATLLFLLVLGLWQWRRHTRVARP
ncbi:MAG: YfhO family protein [Ardenticatenaceae bacterium]|nr:YfhO family protein [Ardenticatenaceae bacterium]